MNFMFDLEDASDDGAIDASEFAIVCSSYGLDKNECEEAFGKMSQVRNVNGSHNGSVGIRQFSAPLKA